MNSLVETWRRIILGSGKSWVVFAHGTCVILLEPEEDPATQAVALLRERGPVHVGTPAGDFNKITLPNQRGWVVTGHRFDGRR